MVILLRPVRYFLVALIVVVATLCRINAMEFPLKTAKEGITITSELLFKVHTLLRYGTQEVGVQNHLLKALFFVHVIPTLADYFTSSKCLTEGITTLIAQLYKDYGHDVSVNVLSMALKDAKVSLCDIRMKEGLTVLHFAAHWGYAEVVTIILAVAERLGIALQLISIPDNSECLAFQDAAYFGHTAIFKGILEQADKCEEGMSWTLLTINLDTMLHWYEDDEFRPTNPKEICAIIEFYRKKYQQAELLQQSKEALLNF